MFDKSDLRAAVEGGAISDDTAKRLEGFLKARNDPDRGLDSENLRFLSNFNDVFLTIGIGVLMTGLSFLSGIAFWNMLGPQKLTIVLTPIPVLIGAWLLAEYFCGKRRLLLPSMALSLIICGAAGALVAAVLAPENERQAANLFGNDFTNTVSIFSYAGFGSSALAATAIFWRFRLPFSLFLLALSVAGLFYTAIARVDDGNLILSGGAMLIAGLATLAFGIWFDAKDPQRTSRTSDHAFWLHMAAAPQIIFGVRGLVLGSGFAPAGAADATVMLLVLVAFALISLMLNRRALIVSGLLSFATALWVLVDQMGGGNPLNTLMLTALIVGGAIVLLGGGWRTARRFVLKLVPSTGVSGRIFPPEPA